MPQVRQGVRRRGAALQQESPECQQESEALLPDMCSGGRADRGTHRAILKEDIRRSDWDEYTCAIHMRPQYRPEGLRIYHNFFRPHEGLKGKTPAACLR